MLDLNRYRQVMSHSGFRNFWIGFTFSSLGDGMARVALTWWVWETTRSPAALGLLTICYTGPVIVGGLAAGWLLDRFDRRDVLRVDAVFRGLAIGVLPVLYSTGHLELWHVYAAAGVYGSLFMISLAGSPAIVPSLVPKELLPTANAMEVLSFTVGGVLGPPLAGVLAAKLGAPNVLMFDALSYFVFAAALTAVPSVPPARSASGQPSGGLREAFQFVKGNMVLRSTTLMYMAANIGAGLLSVWLPVFASNTLHGGPQLYGALLSAVAAGQVVSSLATGAITLPTTHGRAICLVLIAAGTSIAGLALLPRAAVAFAGLALYGLFTGPLTIWAQTLRMEIIPPEMRGRVFALLRTLMQGTTPAGGAAGGTLVPWLGVGPAILLSASCLTLAGLGGLRVRDLQADGAAPPAA